MSCKNDTTQAKTQAKQKLRATGADIEGEELRTQIKCKLPHSSNAFDQAHIRI